MCIPDLTQSGCGGGPDPHPARVHVPYQPGDDGEPRDHDGGPDLRARLHRGVVPQGEQHRPHGARARHEGRRPKWSGAGPPRWAGRLPGDYIDHQLQHQHQLSPKEGGGVDERVGLTDISAFIFAVVAKSFADFPSYHIPPLPTYKRHNGIVCIHICIHLHKQTEQCKHARRRLAHTYIILCFQIRFLLQKNTSSVDVAHGHGNQ